MITPPLDHAKRKLRNVFCGCLQQDDFAAAQFKERLLSFQLGTSLDLLIGLDWKGAKDQKRLATYGHTTMAPGADHPAPCPFSTQFFIPDQISFPRQQTFYNMPV